MADYVFVSYGELLIDEIYDANNTLIKKDGGDSNMNVIYFLSSMGEKCYAIGVVGNDENADIAVSTLENVGVNVDFVQRINKPTNIVYQFVPENVTPETPVVTSCFHPTTNAPSWVVSYDELPRQIHNDLNHHNIILVLEDLESVNLVFLSTIVSKKVIVDIGLVSSIENLTSDYIREFLANVHFCQINIDVLRLLLDKLNAKSLEELCEMFKFELIILTKGEAGATFVYADANKDIHKIEKEATFISTPVDTSGAGDAFLSVFLRLYKLYLLQNKPIDSSFVNDGFHLANLLSATIVEEMGSRGRDLNVIRRWSEKIKTEGVKDNLGIALPKTNEPP